MDRLFSKELLTDFSSPLVLLPDREPLVSEDSEKNHVPELAVTEDVFAKTTFGLVSASQTVSETALVECDSL